MRVSDSASGTEVRTDQGYRTANEKPMTSRMGYMMWDGVSTALKWLQRRVEQPWKRQSARYHRALCNALAMMR